MNSRFVVYLLATLMLVMDFGDEFNRGHNLQLMPPKSVTNITISQSVKHTLQITFLIQEAIAKEAFLQNDKRTTKLLGFDASTILSFNTHSPLKLTPSRRKKTISLAETLPQPNFEKLNSNSDTPQLKKPVLNSKISKVEVTPTQTGNTCLNLVHGPPWFIKNGETVVNDIGITFGFALGVGFTSLVAFLSTRLSYDQTAVPGL